MILYCVLIDDDNRVILERGRVQPGTANHSDYINASYIAVSYLGVCVYVCTFACVCVCIALSSRGFLGLPSSLLHKVKSIDNVWIHLHITGLLYNLYIQCLQVYVCTHRTIP